MGKGRPPFDKKGCFCYLSSIMFQSGELWALGLGGLVSLSGLVAVLLQKKAFNDLTMAYQYGTGYLFFIAGLAAVFAALLFFLAEREPEDAGAGAEKKD